MTAETLAQHCHDLSRAGREALTWLDHPGNAERVGVERKSIVKTRVTPTACSMLATTLAVMGTRAERGRRSWRA